MLTIRHEGPPDIEAIHRLVWAAFGERLEADLVDRLRESGDLILSLVAEDSVGTVVGHIAFSRLRVDGVRAVGLAPVAVHPVVQRQGIGSALIREGLEQLRERREEAVFVLGHDGYYPRFGFRADLAAQFDSPYSGPSFFALELVPGALQGRSGAASYAPVFDSFD